MDVLERLRRLILGVRRRGQAASARIGLPRLLALAATTIATAGTIWSILTATPPDVLAVQISVYDALLPVVNGLVVGAVARRWVLCRTDPKRTPFDLAQKRKNRKRARLTGGGVAGLISTQGVLVQTPNWFPALSPMIAQPLKWFSFVGIAAALVGVQLQIENRQDKRRRAGYAAVLAAVGLWIFKAPPTRSRESSGGRPWRCRR